MTSLDKTPSSTHVIRFQDCDPFNHLNNARHEAGKLKAFCWMALAHFDLKQNRTADHSAEFTELFERIRLPVPQSTFDERSRVLFST